MATTIEMLRDRDEPGYPLNFTSVFFLGAPRMPKLPVKELSLRWRRLRTLLSVFWACFRISACRFSICISVTG